MWRSRRHELTGCHDLQKCRHAKYQASGVHLGSSEHARQGLGRRTWRRDELPRPNFRHQRATRKEHGTILLLTGGVNHGSETRIQYPATCARGGLGLNEIE